MSEVLVEEVFGMRGTMRRQCGLNPLSEGLRLREGNSRMLGWCAVPTSEGRTHFGLPRKLSSCKCIMHPWS
eukprot:1160276-Pelagomonas_calceolata.AAC.4